MDGVEELVSPDGALRLLVIPEDGDVTIGFDGYPWHTHGDVVAGGLVLAGERAARRFVGDIQGSSKFGKVRRGDVPDRPALA